MATSVAVLMVSPRESRVQGLQKEMDNTDAVECLGVLPNSSETLRRLEVISPDVVIVDVDADAADGPDSVAFVERISSQYPHICVMVVSDHADVATMRQYMQAGARDFMVSADGPVKLCTAMLAVYRRERDRHNRNTVALLSERSVRKCRAIAFISSKGGVGKSTLAVNTAAALARQGKRTAMIDLDLQFGDASLLFSLKPTKTFVNLVNEVREMDTDVIERYMTVHPSGVHVLASCQKPEESEYITVAHVRMLIQTLKKLYDYVIIDTGPVVNDIFFAVLESTDERFMVSTLNLGVLKNNRVLLELLGELHYETGQIKHILNRANAKNGVKVRDVKTILRANVYCELDNDFRFVEMAANEGVLFIEKDGKHRLSRQVLALTAKLDADHQGRVSRRNPLLQYLSNGSVGKWIRHG